MEEKSRLRIPFKAILVGAVILVAVFMLFSFAGQFFYFFERVDQDEVGVQFESGRIKGVVGPGVYTDAGLFVNMQRVSSAAVDFIVTDEELITQDKQRIGLVVTGDVFRPGLAQGDTIQGLWAQYNQLYLDDQAVRRPHRPARPAGHESLCRRPQLRRRCHRHRPR